jgi:UDP-glucose 4-epimerase
MYQELQGKTVFVTGGAGFIGSNLAERLLREDAKVIVVDNLSTGTRSNIEHLLEASAKKENIIFIEADANDPETMRHVFLQHPIDYVFHYAAFVGVRNVIERPLEVFRDIEGIKAILALSKEYGVKKVVFASSSEAYGEPTEMPERENGQHNVNPDDPYGLTKLVGENMMKNYWKHHGLPTTSLRFFNVYGPRQNASAYGFVVGIFMKKMLAGEPITIFGDGKQTRDFVYVDDNIEAGIRALLSAKTNGETINVGTGRETTIWELAQAVASVAGVKHVAPTFLPVREVEIRYRSPDVRKMRELLDFVPETALLDGLRKTYQWFDSVGRARPERVPS